LFLTRGFFKLLTRDWIWSL